jgi:hypothetical protein
VDNTISALSSAVVVPNILVLTGRGPCVIDEIRSMSSTNVKFQLLDGTFYAQCAGPSVISILWTSKVKNINFNTVVNLPEINCQVGPWSDWSSCSNNFIMRTRNLVRQASKNGRKCPELTEKSECRDCQVGPWSDWHVCDGSKTKRTREIIIKPNNDGKRCPNIEETVECRDCMVSLWSEWSECDGEKRQRQRIITQQVKHVGKTCPQLEESSKCQDCKVDSWSNWSPCDGTRTKRTRIILTNPTNGGKMCPTLEESIECRDCQVGPWSDWSACDGLNRKRTRKIIVYPQRDGKQCPSLEESLQCNKINWQTELDNVWAMQCQFKGNDLNSVNALGERCSTLCKEMTQCTHYTWKSGMCWLNSGEISKNDASHSTGDICGLITITWNDNLANFCDFPGNDIKSVNVPSEKCASECERTDECTHFAWNSDNDGTCWLKQGEISKNRAVVRNYKGNNLCGVLKIKWIDETWAHFCDFPGNDIKSVNVPGAECYSRCVATSDCTHFAWNPENDGTCWLKRGSLSKDDAVISKNGWNVCGIINNKRKKRNAAQKGQSLVLGTVEYTTFPERIVASSLTGSICYDLANNNSLSSITLALDKYLSSTTGWAIFSLNKIANTHSTWSLNMMQNLFLFGSCSSSYYLGEKRTIFNTHSFVLYYPSEGNCYKSSLDWMVNYNTSVNSDSDKFKSVILLFSLKSFNSEYVSFEKYKLHRSTSIQSPMLMSFLVNSVLSTFEYSRSKLITSEEIRHRIGPYWNVIVNRIGDLLESNVVYRSHTFFRIQIGDYDIVIYHTPYKNC